MKVASYMVTRPGMAGIANRLIRWRFGGKFFSDGEASHTELIFEPSDGVDHLMPDGTTMALNGAVWCASAAALDHIPAWAPYRVGRVGGVRFKRIVLKPEHWEISDYPRDPIAAATWFKKHEGQAYNWGQIALFLQWLLAIVILNSGKRWTCTVAVAAAGGYERPDLYHPALMRSLLK